MWLNLMENVSLNSILVKEIIQNLKKWAILTKKLEKVYY